jgi:hypothetical protein
MMWDSFQRTMTLKQICSDRREKKMKQHLPQRNQLALLGDGFFQRERKLSLGIRRWILQYHGIP